MTNPMTISALDVRIALDHCHGGRPAEAEALYARFRSDPPASPDALMLLGEVARCLGLADDAIAWFEQAARLAPGQAEAWSALGLALIGALRVEEGMAACRRALEIAPRTASAMRALAVGFLRQNRPVEAEQACDAALEAQPGYAEALATLALVRMAAGRAAEADALFRQATATNPTLADALGNHAALLARLGHDAEALELAERAVALRPRLASAQYLIGTLQRRAGNRDAAIARFAQAASADPRHLDARMALAAALIEAGRAGDAAPVCLEALKLAPSDAEVPFRIGSLLMRAGRRDVAIPYLRRAVRLAPGAQPFWTAFALALRGIRFADADMALREDLLNAFAQPGVEASDLVAATASVVAGDPAAVRLAEAARADDDAAVESLLRSGGLAGLAGDRLLHALLGGTVLADAGLERAFTALRRVLLAAAVGAEPFPLDREPWLGLCCALARQCFINEYVYAESAGERGALATLEAILSERLGRGEAPAGLVALLGTYHPLHRWNRADALRGRAWPDELVRLLALQVEEPLEEACLAAGLPALTPIRDAVSQEVRAQYEENPYPRWTGTGLLAEPLPMPRMVQALFPQAAPLPSGPWDAPEVLIAGCGTGREAIRAARHIRGARVLAIDLSRSSLAYAARQSRRLGVTNIAYAQADLLELGSLGRRFDVIHSVGVLHHLNDPMAGLRVLTGLLAPHGVMKLGFYSALARRPILAARAFATGQGVDAVHGATPEGIRRLRQEILALPADHPVHPVVQAPDFYSMSACRDLLLHVREAQATLPWLEQALGALGLELIGFEFDDPAVHQLYRQRFPEDPAMTSLAAWHRLETEVPALFGGLYQFWVRRRA